MNREIKFRAWNKGEGMMEVLSVSFDHMSVRCQWDFEAGGWRQIDTFKIHEQAAKDGGKRSCIMMQYTGLKDRNGKEIYEGDYLTIYGFNDKVEVRWDREYQGWIPKVAEQTDWVINGNIYENK